MPQDRRGQLLDIVGLDEIAATQRRQRLSATVQRQRAARRRAELDIFVRARGAHDLHDIAPHQIGHMGRADRALQRQNIGGAAAPAEDLPAGRRWS